MSITAPSFRPDLAGEKPLAVDLFCGLGGWSEGLLVEGYRVIGFDIERHVYGDHHYPAQLVLQDVRTLHGSQFRDADLIVASPPCQTYSWMAMPWKRAKQVGRALRGEDEFPADWRGSRTIDDLNELFDACFRIQREACAADGRHIPMVVENVKGAQPWVGHARWRYGSFYLWGDVPALMPKPEKRGTKVGGLDWKHPDDPRHRPGQAFNPAAQGAAMRESIKNAGGSWFNVAHNTTSGHGQNPDGRLLKDETGEKGVGPRWDPATQSGGHGMPRWTNPAEGRKSAGAAWFDGNLCQLPSGSARRKFASALIAKIPEPLSRHIARVYLPRSEAAE